MTTAQITDAQEQALQRAYDRGLIWTDDNEQITSSELVRRNGWAFRYRDGAFGTMHSWYSHSMHGDYYGNEDDLARALCNGGQIAGWRRVSFPEFRDSFLSDRDGVLVGRWAGMTMGVTPEGTTHT